MTAQASSPAPAAPAARTRPARRPLDELSLPVDEAMLDAVSSDGPAWLADDRRQAFDAWATLPGETNLLYTPYIDLRAARLEGAIVTTTPAREAAAGALPADADGLIEIVEGRITTVELSEAAHQAGVGLRSLLDDVESHRDLLTEGGALPATDKFAQLTRALWAQGVAVDIPAGVTLSRPIVIRWAVGGSDRALLTRTLVRLGAGASASIVEELIGSDDSVPRRARRSSPARPRSRSAMEASLQVASLQELPATSSRSSIGRPRSGRTPRSSGPSPSSVVDSCAAASTTGSSEIEARSSRSRSCSARRTSCST